MNFSNKFLLLTLSVLLSAPLAAADKTPLAAETNAKKDGQQNEQPVAKELRDEEEVLKQFNTLNYGELAWIKAGYKQKNGRFTTGIHTFLIAEKKKGSDIRLSSSPTLILQPFFTHNEFEVQ